MAKGRTTGVAPVGTGAEDAEVERARKSLRAHPLFAELPPPDLDRVCRLARRITVEPGAVVMEEGTDGDGLYIVVQGTVEITKREGDRDVVLAVKGAGDFLGEMSLLEQAPRSATVRAVGPVELMVIDPSDFQSLVATSPQAAATILGVLARRLRSNEALLMQQEKLASLGTLAAGLAHELNNPAAAIRRAADHMGHTLDELRQRSADLARVELSADQAAAVDRLYEAAAAADHPRLDAVAASDEEQRLAEWLEERRLPDPWLLAPPLVAAGLAIPDLDPLADHLGDAYLRVVVPWLSAALAARGLLDEIATSARAISEIVRAVRTYSYLDQAPVQAVDLHESLESTLVILRHRLADGVSIQRDYDPGLPRIEGYASELTQVWTNLMANAIDAMDGKGTLRLVTRRHEGHVTVDVVDSGPGIPPELRNRIFEPFLTTKEPGAGTGLGLHIVHNIVVDHHRGAVDVESEPGRTAFQVRLPTRLARTER